MSECVHFQIYFEPNSPLVISPKDWETWEIQGRSDRKKSFLAQTYKSD